jgi:hypothetical protein
LLILNIEKPLDWGFFWYNFIRSCEFIDLLIYRCKALDSVFPCLPESTNILDPTEKSDVKILKDIGLCVDEQFYYDTKN